MDLGSINMEILLSVLSFNWANLAGARSALILFYEHIKGLALPLIICVSSTSPDYSKFIFPLPPHCNGAPALTLWTYSTPDVSVTHLEMIYCFGSRVTLKIFSNLYSMVTDQSQWSGGGQDSGEHLQCKVPELQLLIPRVWESSGVWGRSPKHWDKERGLLGVLR